MVNDAESHAEEDRKKRELIDARNQADSMVYMTEKSLKEYGDKVDAATKSAIEAAISKTKTAMEGNEINEIKSVMEDLQQVSHKLAEAMYQQASAGAGAAGPGAGPEGAGPSGKPEEDVVDADFEEVKEGDKK
jgi:molecular chaperone DnaK